MNKSIEVISTLTAPDELDELLKEPFLPIMERYYWIGQVMNAFFCCESNPIDDDRLTDELFKQVMDGFSKYIKITSLLFDTEHLIREEARSQGLTLFEGLTRSEIVKCWAKEECNLEILLLRQSLASVRRSVDLESLLPCRTFCLQGFNTYCRKELGVNDFMKTYYRGKNTPKSTKKKKLA